MKKAKSLAEVVDSILTRINLPKTHLKNQSAKKTGKGIRQLGKRQLKKDVDIENILKRVLKNAKNDEEVKEDEKSEKVKEIKDEKEEPSGYGARRKGNYGIVVAPYLDYSRLFSHLGQFKSKSMYEGLSQNARNSRLLDEDNSFFLVDSQIIDSGIKGIKYFTPGVIVGDPGLVPLPGMSSGDWEKFKLWIKVEYVIYNLMMRVK